MAIRKGDLVQVDFDDHVEDDDKPCRCIVWGRVHKVDRKYYVVDSWALVDCSEAEEQHNNKRFVILKPVIHSIKKLRVQKS